MAVVARSSSSISNRRSTGSERRVAWHNRCVIDAFQFARTPVRFECSANVRIGLSVRIIEYENRRVERRTSLAFVGFLRLFFFFPFFSFSFHFIFRFILFISPTWEDHAGKRRDAAHRCDRPPRNNLKELKHNYPHTIVAYNAAICSRCCLARRWEDPQSDPSDARSARYSMARTHVRTKKTHHHGHFIRVCLKRACFYFHRVISDTSVQRTERHGALCTLFVFLESAAFISVEKLSKNRDRDRCRERTNNAGKTCTHRGTHR